MLVGVWGVLLCRVVFCGRVWCMFVVWCVRVGGCVGWLRDGHWVGYLLD